jgi:hypothetical protein
MSPETITAFPEHRWAKLTPHPLGWQVSYGIGRICSSSCLFLDRGQALFAQVAWESEGIEPRAADTRRDWPAVTDEQLERAAQRLEVRT